MTSLPSRRPATPTRPRLRSTLGPARAAWDAMVNSLRDTYAPVIEEWAPCQAKFGSYCRLVRRGRRLVYLIPHKNRVEVMVGLGPRATGLALGSELPAATKQAIMAARVYPEGRFIHLDVATVADVPVVLRLVAIKVTPK